MSASDIAKRNDLMRKTFLWCKVVLSIGVESLDEKTRSSVIEAVQRFNHFTEENDPHGEHDFGKVTVAGTCYFWKFDYYDDAYEGFKKDGNRLLMIMRADEY